MKTNVAQALALALLMEICAFGQTQPKTNQPGAREEGERQTAVDQQKLDAILDELRQIRQLLAEQNKYFTQHAVTQQPAAPPVAERVSIALDSGWNRVGSDNAPVAVIEFADFQCPYCRSFHTETFAELKKKYIDTGRVRFISRDLPLDFHGNAMNAALAARCAGDQNKYWELRDSLIVNSKDLARESITKYAHQAGLDMAAFTACMDSQKYKSKVENDRDEAGKLGLSGTPSFVIGKTKGNNLEGVKIVGAQSYAVFDSKIQELLATRAAVSQPDPSDANQSFKPVVTRDSR